MTSFAVHSEFSLTIALQMVRSRRNIIKTNTRPEAFTLRVELFYVRRQLPSLLLPSTSTMSGLPPLVLGSDEARLFQQLIKEELVRRQWSDGDDDEVMAEYIGVMVANNKTAAQIASELEELVGDGTAEGSGSDSVKDFVEWLWNQRATLHTRSHVTMEIQSATTSSDAKSREQWRANEAKRRSLSPEGRERINERNIIQGRDTEMNRRDQRGGDRWADERQERNQSNAHDRAGR